QVRGETMPKQMRINVALQTGASRVFLHQLPDTNRRQLPAASGQKNFAARLPANELRSLLGKIERECFTRFAADRHYSSLAAFAEHAQRSIFQIEVFQPRAG